MKRFLRALLLLSFMISGALENDVSAGLVELSGTFSYSQSNYGNSNYTWSRRWGTSFGYYFLELSELEISFTDILFRSKFGATEDTT
jgi:hypothetical protein